MRADENKLCILHSFLGYSSIITILKSQKSIAVICLFLFLIQLTKNIPVLVPFQLLGQTTMTNATCRRKHLIWTYGFRDFEPMTIISYWRAWQQADRNTTEIAYNLIYKHEGERAWGTGNGSGPLKSQTLLPVTCLFHQGTLPNPFWTV